MQYPHLLQYGLYSSKKYNNYRLKKYIIKLFLSKKNRLPLQSAGASHLCPAKMGSSLSSFWQTLLPLSHLWGAAKAVKIRALPRIITYFKTINNINELFFLFSKWWKDNFYFRWMKLYTPKVELLFLNPFLFLLSLVHVDALDHDM